MLTSPNPPMPHPKAKITQQATNTERDTRGMPSGISPDIANAPPAANNPSALLLSDETIIAPKINGLVSIVFHVTLDNLVDLLNAIYSFLFQFFIPHHHFPRETHFLVKRVSDTRGFRSVDCSAASEDAQPNRLCYTLATWVIIS